jgi:uncharacterized membrane protein YfcA
MIGAMTSPLVLALLFGAGALGGALNSVAGGGSFIVFPSILFAGVPPVAANATTAVALWPAGVSSTWAYRREVPRERAVLAVLSVASGVGGALGAKLLLVTSDETFAVILPWLMLAASIVFTVGPRAATATANARPRVPLAVGAVVQLLISTYGGYFGGGMGILMLATYTLMGMTNIHAMNGMKTFLGTLINGVANVLFFVDRKVVLVAAAPALVGSIVGGFAGAALARRVDGKHVRRFVLAVAWSLTAYFFWRASTRR